MYKIRDNTPIVFFSLGFSQSGFVSFLFIVDWNNKEGRIYNMSKTGPVINAQSLMISSGSSNETLTAVGFQIHQTPIMKHCENI